MSPNRAPLTIALFIVALTLSAFACFYGLGDVSIRYSDEATHVRVIQEMRASGDYLHPTLEGAPYMNKPPLKMWMTNASIALFGENNVGFRFLDGLSALLTLMTVFLLGTRMFGSPWAGLFSVLPLLARSGFFYWGRFNQATQDAMVVACNTLAIGLGWLICERLQKGDRQQLPRWDFLFIGVLCGAGALIKSIVGFVPLLVLPLPFLVTGRVGVMLRHRLPWILGAGVVMVLIIFSYYGYILIEDPHRWNAIFGYDIERRLFTEGFHHQDEPLFYLKMLFVVGKLMAPWLLILGVLWAFANLFFRPVLGIFLLSWGFLPLLVFSCLQSRAPHYLAPAFPAYGLMAGGAMWSAAYYCWKRRGHGLTVMSTLAVLFVWTTFFRLGADAWANVQIRLSERKKFQIEPIARAMESSWKRDNKGVLAVYRLPPRLVEETYQSWRLRFYLDPLRNRTRVVDDFDALQRLQSEHELKFVLTNGTEALRLLSETHPCGYYPLPMPEGKKDLVDTDQANPELAALAYGNCQGLEAFHPNPAAIGVQSDNFEPIFGFSTLRPFGRVLVRKLSETTAALKFHADTLTAASGAELQLMLVLRTAQERTDPQEIEVSLNGVSLNKVTVSRQLIENFKICIPSKDFRIGENILMLRNVSDHPIPQAVAMRGFIVTVAGCGPLASTTGEAGPLVLQAQTKDEDKKQEQDKVEPASEETDE